METVSQLPLYVLTLTYLKSSNQLFNSVPGSDLCGVSSYSLGSAVLAEDHRSGGVPQYLIRMRMVLIFP